MFVSCTEHENRSAKYAVLNILIARVQGRIKRYRGGGRKGDELRCEGGGGGERRGAGRQQRNMGGRQMSRQNHSTNITTTTFLTHVSRQYLKIIDNKTRAR